MRFQVGLSGRSAETDLTFNVTVLGYSDADPAPLADASVVVTPGAVYFVAVKYNPASLVGTPVTAPNPTVTYNFVTSADGVALPTGVVSLKVAPK